MPRYAFLTPVYKTSFLAEALSSIQSQSFTDFEVFISDDCSPENVYSVVSPFLNDSRFSYNRNEVNLGAVNLVNHWNKLLDTCNAEYVIVASDDDVYDSDFLYSIEQSIQNYPDCGIYRAGTRIIDEDGKIIRFDSKQIDAFLSSVDYIDYLLRPESVLCIGNCVFKTQLLIDKGGFVNFPCGWKSDTATQLMLSLNGVVVTSDILFSFRMSGYNISSKATGDKKLSSMKIEAILSFDEWFQNLLKSDHFYSERHRISRAVRHRLEGESRSYFNSLSFKSFCFLLYKFVKEGWFLSFRNFVSFVFSWFRLY